MKDTCLVKNRGASHVSYRIPEDGIRRSFAPGETKEISYKELEKLTFQPGGMMILTNYLQLIEENALNAFGIRTEPEYHMSEADVAKLIKTGTVRRFKSTRRRSRRSVRLWTRSESDRSSLPTRI